MTDILYYLLLLYSST